MHRYLIIGVLIFLIIVSAVLVLFKPQNTFLQPKIPKATPQSTQNQKQTQVNQPLKVIETNPASDQTDVYPGEIEISLSLNQEINTESGFTLEITPALPFYWKFTNQYPTKVITARVYGGLQPSTKYTLIFKDKLNKTTHTWSFTTSSEQNESSSSLIEDREKEFNNTYFPLFDYIPYESTNFNLDYTDKLTIKVTIKNPNVSAVKEEVLEWIKSKGVDPSTHKINYINKY